MARICNKCGNAMPKNAKFCKRCGKKVEKRAGKIFGMVIGFGFASIVLGFIYLILASFVFVWVVDPEMPEYTPTPVVTKAPTPTRAPTLTPAPTNTPTPTPIPATPTPSFRPSEYRTDLTYEDLARMPKKYMGEKVCFEGVIIEDVASFWGKRIARISTAEAFGYYSDDVFYCVYDEKEDFRFLEDDKVIFYGTYEGLETYTAVLGNTISIPKISIDEMFLVEE